MLRTNYSRALIEQISLHTLAICYNFYLCITLTEEIITKRKTDIITTKQIETRVKRNVVLEDGKVVEDSGPIVSTNTTEDVEKQESEETEVSFRNFYSKNLIIFL